MINRLNNEKGVTLLETLATTIIIAFAMISLYMGIIYADKQVQRNYHDRVATLQASGELDWQAYYIKNYKEFDIYNDRQVVLDRLARGSLIGFKSTSSKAALENPFGLSVPYTILTVSVRWLEPGDTGKGKERRIVVREDFY